MNVLTERKKTGTEELRDQASQRVIHDRWSNRVPYWSANNPQCGECRWYIRLAGALGSDWGVCSRSISPYDGALVFEHQGCNRFERTDQ